MKHIHLFRYFMLVLIGRANWTGLKYFLVGREYDMKPAEVRAVCDHLLNERLIGLSYRSTHLTSYCILFIHWVVTGHWIKWSHAWINVDDESTDPLGLVIYEAVAEGVRKAMFWQVLLVDDVALFRPKNLTPEVWAQVSLNLQKDLGNKYDCHGNIKDHSEVNCIEEVVFAILHADPGALPNLVKMMEKRRILTPQMIEECGDFEKVVEFRHPRSR